jgi:hypothetical protein
MMGLNERKKLFAGDDDGMTGYLKFALNKVFLSSAALSPMMERS